MLLNLLCDLILILKTICSDASHLHKTSYTSTNADKELRLKYIWMSLNDNVIEGHAG